jgi:hypothetical protein
MSTPLRTPTSEEEQPSTSGPSTQRECTEYKRWSEATGNHYQTCSGLCSSRQSGHCRCWSGRERPRDLGFLISTDRCLGIKIGSYVQRATTRGIRFQSNFRTTSFWTSGLIWAYSVSWGATLSNWAGSVIFSMSSIATDRDGYFARNQEGWKGVAGSGKTLYIQTIGKD